MVKCEKCGADIPDQAAFCPGCGAPKAAEQPAPEPQPVVQPAPKPVKSGGSGLQGLVDMVFSKMVIMLGVCIGALLAWIGTIVFTFVAGTGTTVNTILDSIGFGGIAILLIGGGLLNKKIDQYVRAGMVIAGGFIVYWAL